MTAEEMERRFFELKGKLDVGAITEVDFKAEIEKLKFQDKPGRWWMIGAQSGKWYTFDGTRWLPGKPPIEPVEPPAPSPAVEPAPPQVVTPPAPDATRELPPAPMPPAAPAIQPQPANELASTAPIPLPAAPGTDLSAGEENKPAFVPAAAPTPDQPPPAFPPLPLPKPVLDAPAAVVLPRPQPLAKPELGEPTPVIPTRPQHLRRASRIPAIPKLSIGGPTIVIAGAVFAIVAVLCMWLAVDNFVPGKPISSFFAGLTGSKSTAALTPTPSAGQPGAAKDVTAFITVGDQLLLQSNIDSAITQYASAAQAAPSSPIPPTHWSRALAFKGLMQDALDQARQAVQRGPNDVEANAQLTRALTWNGQTNEAIAAGEKAIQLDPKNANAHAFLAEAYLLAHRIPDAQSEAQAAQQLAPQSAEAYRAQAWVLTIQGQRNAALDTWRQTVALEPDFYFRHFELGQALRVYFNASADAVPEYRKSISLYGAYVPAYSQLGMALIDTGAAQEAAAQLQHALTLDPNNSVTYAFLGLAFGKQNQCTQAVPYFDQALKLDPNNALAQRGSADCKSGKTPSAPPLTPLPVPLPPSTLAPANP